ncbi:MAG: hypothetical protein GXP13_02070 [Gammaproteobacteria bacterium]|nr:hypothetical protein [Gammaproteobacteria bacterium]
MAVYSVDKLISEARRIAADYRRATGKSLGGVSGEIAENDAARLLNLELVNDASVGYDAIGKGSREGKKIQIKGRAIFDESKSGQRIGQLKVGQEWDSVVLVIMNEDFEPVEIHEATREALAESLDDKGNKNKRGAMSLSRFKHLAELVWSAEEDEAGETNGNV